MHISVNVLQAEGTYNCNILEQICNDLGRQKDFESNRHVHRRQAGYAYVDSNEAVREEHCS